MLPFLTLLLACRLAGEVLSRAAALPVPGPVVGLLLLFAGLALRRRPAPVMEENADRVLGYLSLLFVPAGVGVVQYVPLLADEWLPITASILGSAVAAIAVTGLAVQVLSGGRDAGRSET